MTPHDGTLIINPGDLPPEIPETVLVREIGRGGMGVVYLGRQEFLDRDVAVKVVSRNQDDELFLARFKREARILAGMTHPNIVSCYQAGTTQDRRAYLVMEFVEGPNLHEWVTGRGPLGVAHALIVARQLASALRHAHEVRIIHRDVKPQNVLLAPDRSTSADVSFPVRAKLADLGLARSTLGDREPGEEAGAMLVTSPGVAVGTPSTMSPEQFDDPGAVDHRSDIYGLGCVLFFALTGRAAFPGRSVEEIYALKRSGQVPSLSAHKVPALPSELCELVRRMLAAKRSERPSDYEELEAELSEIARRVARTTRERPPAARSTRRVLLVAGLALGVTGAFGGILALTGAGRSDGPVTTDDSSAAEGAATRDDEPETSTSSPDSEESEVATSSPPTGATSPRGSSEERTEARGDEDAEEPPGDSSVAADVGVGDEPEAGSAKETETETAPPAPTTVELEWVRGEREGESFAVEASLGGSPVDDRVEYAWRVVGDRELCDLRGTEAERLEFCVPTGFCAEDAVRSLVLHCDARVEGETVATRELTLTILPAEDSEERRPPRDLPTPLLAVTQPDGRTRLDGWSDYDAYGWWPPSRDPEAESSESGLAVLGTASPDRESFATRGLPSAPWRLEGRLRSLALNRPRPPRRFGVRVRFGDTDALEVVSVSADGDGASGALEVTSMSAAADRGSAVVREVEIPGAFGLGGSDLEFLITWDGCALVARAGKSPLGDDAPSIRLDAGDRATGCSQPSAVQLFVLDGMAGFGQLTLSEP